MISKMRARALTAVAIVLSVLLNGCPGKSTVNGEEPKSKAGAPREVRVTPAAERTLARTVSATGTLAADDQVVLGTKVAGGSPRSPWTSAPACSGAR
jgi:multidrug efflux pump subunit AcrA (membrane-fusion protein)